MSADLSGLKLYSALDFRNNKGQLGISYALRFLSAPVFGFLFMLYIVQTGNGAEMSLKDYLSIGIEGVPDYISILLLVVDLVFVLYIHELTHALVLLLTHKHPPKIGMNGLVIYAASPDALLTKGQFIAAALAPFILISALGLMLMSLIPLQHISWVFIPVTVNAAAAGGDFMAVIWSLRHKEGLLYNDLGDITNAYEKA